MAPWLQEKAAILHYSARRSDFLQNRSLFLQILVRLQFLAIFCTITTRLLIRPRSQKIFCTSGKSMSLLTAAEPRSPRSLVAAASLAGLVDPTRADNGRSRKRTAVEVAKEEVLKVSLATT